MKIENLGLVRGGKTARLSARVSWEDSNRAPQEVYFEVPEQFGDYLSESMNPFALAALMPAHGHGERRLWIEGGLCPELKQGMEMALGVIRDWYAPTRPPLRIEAGPCAAPPAKLEHRAAFFMTGGVDSLSCLRANHLEFAPGHPGRIQDGLLVYGFEVEQPEPFQHVLDTLSQLADLCGLRLIPISTNERQLEPDWDFWIDYSEGALLSAVAQSLARKLSVASIGSSFDVPNLHRVASHPMLDPYYSSQVLRIRHEGAHLSRFEKTRLLAEWPEGLQFLHVCNLPDSYRPGCVNCGQCEKCLRTRLALLALGVRDHSHAFPQTEITEELVRKKVRLHRKNFRFWPELIEPLREAGHDDFADAIQDELDRYAGEIGWKGLLRRFDRTRLNGSLHLLKQALREGFRSRPRAVV